MRRLIDADSLPYENQVMSYDDEWCLKVSDIEKAPTVDAVEVVHGRWLPVDDCLFPGTKEKCSLCGVRKGTGYVFHYCPNCGAKMDGGKDNG